MSEELVKYDVTNCDPAAEAAGRERHHPYGPSRWPALAVCPHYHGKPGGADAAKGTALHELFAKAAKGLLGDDAEAEAADAFERNTIALGRTVLELAGGNGEKVMVEETVACPAPDGAECSFEDGEIFGRTDAAWFDVEGHLHVADLKMVENPDRDYRPQLVAYAYGLAMEWGVKPTCHLHTLYVDTRTAKSETVAWEDLDRDYRWLRTKVYAASRPEAAAAQPVQSGWCQLCAKFEGCSAPRAVAKRCSGGDIADLAKPEEWGILPSTKKAQICVLADTVAKWAKAVKANAANDAKAGIPIEDPDNGIYYGLQTKRGNLVLDTDKSWELAKERGISRERFVGCLKLDAESFKSLLKASMKAKEADELMESCGTRGAGTSSFVRKGVK